MLRAAARRFAFLLGAVTVGTAVLSALGGLVSGTSLDRAISVGFYLVGSFMLIAGFFIGNRGPVRPKGTGPMLFGSRMMRWATPLEREDSLNESALFVAVGFVLILVGVAVDTRTGLF